MTRNSIPIAIGCDKSTMVILATCDLSIGVKQRVSFRRAVEVEYVDDGTKILKGMAAEVQEQFDQSGINQLRYAYVRTVA